MRETSKHWNIVISVLGDPEHIEAIGAVACHYNRLEYTLFGLFAHYSKLGHAPARSLFISISNPLRLSLFGKFIESSDESEEVKDLLRHFSICFDVCAQNRNFLMHAWVTRDPKEGELTLLRTMKRDPSTFDRFSLSITELRATAEDIWWVQMFGQSILYWVPLSPERRISALDRSCEGLPAIKGPVPRLLTCRI
jgi:hypothetical protein